MAVGFALFAAAKVSLYRRGIWWTFGTRHLSERMSNCYRLGYWLLALGFVVAFAALRYEP